MSAVAGTDVASTSRREALRATTSAAADADDNDDGAAVVILLPLKPLSITFDDEARAGFFRWAHGFPDSILNEFNPKTNQLIVRFRIQAFGFEFG